eukprot:CAMPEP_0172659836 /NCGR_PEP_ID=MMETSP1074-20121228/3719_1 /TAXON_ID=2916 /ORGANISM="Ceratium fusus, Strain PA161109" /LENGTH=57 /DNA_ID=CAMNT_0013475403 /DNA_START=1416 /DNA_END=1589 /DNA_ORIENTATION=+
MALTHILPVCASDGGLDVAEGTDSTYRKSQAPHVNAWLAVLKHRTASKERGITGAAS